MLASAPNHPGGRREQGECDFSGAGCILGIVSSAFAVDTSPELLAGLRRRESAAFATLYGMFERPIHNLAWRMLANREDAREVLQDTLLQVHTRIEQFRGDAPFWSWLRKIAVNAALARLRSSTPPHDELDDEMAAETASLPDWIDLEKGLAQLPAQTRSVLWLHLVEGYSHEEIAQEFGRSLSFSKSQVQRGARRLREFMRSPDEQPPEQELRHAVA